MTSAKNNPLSTILVIDDQIMTVKMLAEILNPSYIVYTAYNGTEGIALAEKHQPDLILLDIVMPDMDGYQVTEKLRESERTRNIPVIFITGLNNLEEEKKGLRYAADYISKPFSASVVKLRVQNQLKIIKYVQSAEYDLINYRLASEAMQIALWRVDVVTPVMKTPHDENIWTWSQEFRHMLGFTDESDFPNTIGAFLSRLHPDDAHNATAAFIEHFNDRSGKTPYRLEYRLRHKDGKYRYFDGFGTTLRDKNGLPLRVSGTIRDITEKKRMERELEQQNNLLHAVNQAASVLLTAKDDESFNESLQRGMEIVGQSLDIDCVEIWQNETRNDELFAVLQHCWLSEVGAEIKADLNINVFPYSKSPDWERRLSEGEFIHGPVSEFEQADREFLEVFKIKSVLVIPIHIQNSFRGFCCIDDCRNSRSFTEDEVNILRSVCYMLVNAINQRAVNEVMRRAEVAEERNKAKSQFLATISHEIRTPMNSIMGFSELALDTPERDIYRIRDYILKIKDSTKWLLNIVNDILDISKIESGKMELAHLPFDLTDVISRCESVILPEIKSKKLDLITRADSLDGKKTVGDPVRLYQAIMNLLSNAVKFTDSGTVSLTVYAKDDMESLTEPDKTKLRFEVQDQGIGMAPEQVEKVFAPFVQADTGRTRSYGGTGLGLPITKNIVEHMGGELSVISQPGQGSTFSFEVDFDTVDAAEYLAPKLIMIEKPQFAGGLVLVCDDNVMNQEVIKEHLAQVGLTAELAANGKEGLELVRSRVEQGLPPFDLIFMDIFMPVMDGIEATRRINNIGTGVPIIAMTANIMSTDLENYKKHGMPDYVGKPFTSQELWRVLLKYFKPVAVSDTATGDTTSVIDNAELQRKLRESFFKTNQNKFAEITAAIEANDIETAHRLTHSLKSNAGQIFKTPLQTIAKEVEFLLKAERLPIPPGKMAILEKQLNEVIDELRPLYQEQEKAEKLEASAKPTLTDPAKIIELFKRLKPLLEMLSPDSVKLVDEIRAVGGTEKLIQLIEDYDFATAADELAKLMEDVGKK
ncbi:MAG: response regulator [Oscillospiraceae bacterium]|nr:response regulator [Oscillospiraceae bacterium]